MVTVQAIEYRIVDSNCSGCRGRDHIARKCPGFSAGAQRFEIFRRDQ
jgi:hypothetical protein